MQINAGVDKISGFLNDNTNYQQRDYMGTAGFTSAPQGDKKKIDFQNII